MKNLIERDIPDEFAAEYGVYNGEFANINDYALAPKRFILSNQVIPNCSIPFTMQSSGRD